MEENVIQGWMNPAELEWIGKVAAQMRSCTEIGAWKGRTTKVLLNNCNGPVQVVDHWQGSRDEREGPHREAVDGNVFAQFRANVGNPENLIVLRGDSVAMAEQADESDFVFIDAGHAYDEVKADIKAWRHKAKRILAGHDYDHPDVKRAVDEAFGEHVRCGPGSIWHVSMPITKIMIGTPCPGVVHIGYHMSIIRLVHEMGPHLQFANPTGDSLVTRARIDIMGQFLRSACTHLMFIDSDITFDPAEIVRLVKSGFDIVGGVYRKRQIEERYPANVVQTSEGIVTRDERIGALLMKDLPTGFMLIRREALERMVAAYPETRCMIGEGGWEAECNTQAYALCDTFIDDDGMYLSEDYAFCRRAQRIGIQVWALPDIELGHSGLCQFTGRLSSQLVEQPESLAA